MGRKRLNIVGDNIFFHWPLYQKRIQLVQTSNRIFVVKSCGELPVPFCQMNLETPCILTSPYILTDIYTFRHCCY